MLIEEIEPVIVFHGFRDFHHAVEAAKYGLSGSEQVGRVYSYEADNNPKGLFITKSFRIAQEFVGGYGPQAIIEFRADLNDLDPPAWPGGSYTVQGGMAQYFGHGPKGRAARRQVQKKDDVETRARAEREPEYYGDVVDSERPHLSFMLNHTREEQALFVGHLNPSDIIAMHVQEVYRGPWAKMSVPEFLSVYGHTEHDTKKRDRVFKPNDVFDGDVFMSALNRKFGLADDDSLLSNAWTEIKRSRRPIAAFISTFDYYLWPKQYVAAFNWMKDRYRSLVTSKRP